LAIVANLRSQDVGATNNIGLQHHRPFTFFFSNWKGMSSLPGLVAVVVDDSVDVRSNIQQR